MTPRKRPADADELADLDAAAPARPPKLAPPRTKTRTRAIVQPGWSLRRDGRSYGPGATVQLEREDAAALQAEGAIADPPDLDD